jgi:hypothetical protein
MILGKIPREIHNFINKIVAGSPAHLKKRGSLSDSAKQFLEKILVKFKTFSRIFRYKLIKEIPYPEEQYQHVDLFNEIPSEIRNIIVGYPREQHNQSTNITRSYEFTIGSRTIRVHILLPLPFDNIDMNKDGSITQNPNIKMYFDTTVRLIWLWFSIASEYVNCDCGETVDIYLYLTQHYKKKPKYGPIDTIHANTAFTRTCEKNSVIQIYREEEWFKVLIHETFHTLGLDFSGMNETNIALSKTIKKEFHIQTDGLLFETYCETWATILNVMFVTAFMEGYPRTQHISDVIIRKMENLLYLESKHALFQSSKVLQHMNISYQDLIHPTDPESQLKLQEYREETNVICYYVLKSVLLYHLDEFIQWCWKHNNGSLNFVKNDDNVKDFYRLIYKLYKSDVYIREHLYMETKLVQGSPKIEHETLRMTIYG